MNYIPKWSTLLIVLGMCLCIPTSWARAPFFEKAREYDQAGKWEEAYQAYLQSMENGEPVSTNETKRAITYAFLVATEQLGRFDEAVALADNYASHHVDGYIHHLLGCFYRDQLHEYDKAREEFRLSYEDFMATDYRRYEALYNRHEQASTYLMELYEMEYYANRKHRKSYTRKAHAIFLEGYALIDGIENEESRYQMREHYKWRLREIVTSSWYPGSDSELAKQYEKTSPPHRSERTNPFQQKWEEAMVLYSAGQWAEAAPKIEAFINLNSYTRAELSSHDLLVYCYYATKDWENTLRTADRAMDLIESKINAMKTDIEKSVAIERGWLATYERAIEAAIKLKRYGKAFEIMERSQARAMLDLLGNRDYSSRRARLSEDERELLLLQSRIDEIKDAIEKERAVGRLEEMASLQRSLVIVEDTSSKIQKRADLARREIMTPKRMDPVTIQEAQALVGNDTLITVWAGLYMSVITKDKVTSRYIRGSSYFDKLIRNFRKGIDNQGTRARALVLESKGEIPPDADDKIREIGKEMYRIIFKPMEKYFSKESDKIYIVYDRSQPLIPYQVLHDGEQYLAEKYSLVYAPSVSVLKHCMERRHPMGQKLLALGNPSLGDSKYDLVYAEDEVKQLADIYSDSRILTRTEASEAAVQLLSSDVDILHFACHGVIDDEDPMKSHLRLTPDKSNDGFLTADEIMDLHLQCSLVTLSACDTGRGRILMGGDILGLTRAWMYAGAPSVLASLWKVDDRATSRLMTAFYKNLKTHDKAKSLQLAQIDMIKEGLSPYYWAAFCLYGDSE